MNFGDEENCPPESGGQRDREADPAGEVPKPQTQKFCFGTTPALRATPPDSGGEFCGVCKLSNILAQKYSGLPNSFNPSGGEIR
jgi:hypothetical protein